MLVDFSGFSGSECLLYGRGEAEAGGGGGEATAARRGGSPRRLARRRG